MGKKNSSVFYLAVAGVFAALIAVMTAYLFHIPLGTNGGYIHFGDTLIYLCASMLPAPYAVAAAAIGGGLADLLTAPMWVPATVIIKAALALCFTSKGEKLLCRRNIAAGILGFFITWIGYFFAEKILFGGYVAFLASAPGEALQSGGSFVLYLMLAKVLDHRHVSLREKAGKK